MTAPFLHHDHVLAAHPAHVGRLTVVIKSLSESQNLGFVLTLTTRVVRLDSVNASLLLPKFGEVYPTRFDYIQAKAVISDANSALSKCNTSGLTKKRYRLSIACYLVHTDEVG